MDSYIHVEDIQGLLSLNSVDKWHSVNQRHRELFVPQLQRIQIIYIKFNLLFQILYEIKIYLFIISTCTAKCQNDKVKSTYYWNKNPKEEDFSNIKKNSNKNAFGFS